MKKVIILALSALMNSHAYANQASKCSGSPDQIADALRSVFDNVVEFYKHLDSPNVAYEDFPTLPAAIEDGGFFYMKDVINRFGFGYVEVLSVECVTEFFPNSSYHSLVCGISAKDGPLKCVNSGLFYAEEN